MPADEAAVRRIKFAIDMYLATHPDAADAAEGIQQWWLPSSLIEEPPQLVEIALDELVAEGLLRRVAQEDDRMIYSSARRPA